jgi:hypothetical protein
MAMKDGKARGMVKLGEGRGNLLRDGFSID